MITTYVNKELFNQDSIDKQIKIEIVGKTDVITNEHLKSEALTLEESLCSDSTLRFGSCESSSITFEMGTDSVAYSLKGKTIKVSETLNGDEENPFDIGTFIVTSDKKSADGLIRTVIGHDAMKWLLEKDVSEWYNNYFPEKTTTHTLKQVRESFLAYVGIEIGPTTELANENVPIGKTITPTELKGASVINAICEVSGVFGHIGRDNKFRYIDVVSQSVPLYPSDTLFPNDFLFPSDGANRLLSFLDSSGGYISGQFEDFEVERITGITIKTREGGIGCTVGTEDNVYTIQNNFLLFDKDLAELTIIANNLLKKIGGVNYMPYEIECKGNPCFEVGDGIIAETRNGIIKSYILHRTLKGIQSLHDVYRADGDDKFSSKVRTISDMFDEYSEKTNVLTRDLAQTQSTLADTAQGLQTQITQTAGRVESVATTANGAYSIASQTASEITNYVKLGESYSGMKITSSGIEISSTGALRISTDNFTLDANGNVTVKGRVEATSGSLGKLRTDISGLYYDGLGGVGFLLNEEGFKIGSSTVDGDTVSTTYVNAAALTVGGHSLTWITIDGHKVLGYD